MSEVIRLRCEGGVIEVTLDRPKVNAIDLATSRIMDAPELRIMIVTWAGKKFFCAGGT